MFVWLSPDTNYLESSRSICGVTCVSSCSFFNNSFVKVEISQNNFEKSSGKYWNFFLEILGILIYKACPVCVANILDQCPVLILGTYHDKGAQLFWHALQQLQLQGHPILCWKFCHVLHKMIRDGHPQASGGTRFNLL